MSWIRDPGIRLNAVESASASVAAQGLAAQSIMRLAGLRDIASASAPP
jgi:hypothetical protein